MIFGVGMAERDEILKELETLLTGFWLTDLANFSALFYHRVSNLNWIGFYLSDGKKLKLGPFAGKPACVEIAFDRGVCGAAFSQKKALVVEDVHKFLGHISCDPDSLSEMVLPFYAAAKLVGVLDIDSPLRGRFSDNDLRFFFFLFQLLSNKIGESFNAHQL